MADRGYFRLYRGWMDNPVFRDETMTEREAWVWLIEEAAFKETRKRVGGHIVTLKRGQLAHSIRFMAEAWGWSKSRVHRFLSKLQQNEMIFGTAAGRGDHIITICNYDNYQAAPGSSDTESGTGAGQQRDSSGTNEKEGKELKEGNSRCPDGHTSPSGELIAFPENNKPAQVAEQMRAIWNEKCSGNLQRVNKLNQSRIKAAHARFKDEMGGDLEVFRFACQKVTASPFLRGEEGRESWRGASFDWLLAPKNFLKVVEGNYDPKPDNKRNSGASKAGGGPMDAGLANLQDVEGW